MIPGRELGRSKRKRRKGRWALGIVAGSILVFIPSAGEFVIPNLLGGSRTVMMGNLVQQQFLQARDWAFGSALAMILAALLLAAILFYVRRVGTDKLEGV